MARINRVREPIYTHEGAKAQHINTEQQLRRSVMACMLWEQSFYEDGKTIADRIALLIPKVDPIQVALIANEARNKMHLRHVPLLIAREMSRIDSHKDLVSQLLGDIICRPDELTEFLAIYWKDGRQPLSGQVKKGLASAFTKFDEYQLAKYNRDTAIRLRDVLFLCHAKPKDKAQDALWKRLINNELKTPDTWEVALSSGGDKKVHWERLLHEKRLGGMALLRNLRNMDQAGVHEQIVSDALREMKPTRILPFRFIAAAKHAPHLESDIETAMFRCAEQLPKLDGKTILIVDTSGSMHGGQVSRKSDLTRVDAATALAILVREQCENVKLYATAGNDYSRIHATCLVPSRRGFALSDAIWGDHMQRKIGGGGIFLKQCMDYVFEREKTADRIIVFTDEQDCDNKANPASANAFGKRNY